ncbi:MAG: AAA family ATPase [Gammaproteobacteria bacterium]|nr:AAA family ATPase [Gammaproteobacteria bacterium]
MYEAFYGLKHKPFQLSPDPAFFYSSDHHKKAISYLKYGLSQREGFIVITGAIGTGKTTIARSLLEQVDRDNIVAAQLVTTILNPTELLEMIVLSFGISSDAKNKTSLLHDLEQFLLSLHQQGKRAVLLVDEAQNLPAESVEELRMLSNFQVGKHPLFQSFLLGQDELRMIIQSPGMEQFRQRIIASCHLQALTLEETRNYIQHRLIQAGWQGESLISYSAFSIIHAKTQGIPRMINLFMDRLMLFGFIEELDYFNIEAVDCVIAEMSGELTMAQSKELPPQGAATIVQPALQKTNTDYSNTLEQKLTQATEQMLQLNQKLELLLSKQ